MATAAVNADVLVKDMVSKEEWQTRVNKQTLEVFGMGASLTWSALLRKMDRLDSSFRD